MHEGHQAVKKSSGEPKKSTFQYTSHFRDKYSFNKYPIKKEKKTFAAVFCRGQLQTVTRQTFLNNILIRNVFKKNTQFCTSTVLRCYWKFTLYCTQNKSLFVLNYTCKIQVSDLELSQQSNSDNSFRPDQLSVIFSYLWCLLCVS